MTRARVALAAAGLALAVAAPAGGASLTEQLDGLLQLKGFPVGIPVEIPLLGRAVARGADFPTVATTPDFLYRYNPKTAVWERTAKSLGPIFVDTADTVGARVTEVGLSFLYSDFRRRDGERLAATPLQFSFFEVSHPLPGTTAIVRKKGQLRFEEFHLDAAVLSWAATFGLTERWDVGLVVPGVRTSLQARGRVEDVLGRPLKRFDIDDARYGLGDVLLKTKYRLADVAGAQLASTVVARFPTGAEGDFHGLGDFTVTPGLILTRALGQHAIHATAGFEANADDLERCRGRYGVGASLHVAEGVSVLAEVLGSSAITDDTFTVHRAGFGIRLVRGVPRLVPARPLVVTLARTDIIDGGLGLKVQIFKKLVGYASVLFPLTSDGVRADVVPVGGLEMTF